MATTTMATMVAALCLLQPVAAQTPAVVAEGGSIKLSIPDDGLSDVYVARGSQTSAVVNMSTALALNATMFDIKYNLTEEMMEADTAIARRTEAVESAVASAVESADALNSSVRELSSRMTEATTGNANEIATLLSTVARLTSTLNAVADCDSANNCVPAVPTCNTDDLNVPASGGLLRVIGTHVDNNVPLGGIVEVGCEDGYYSQSGTITSTCQSSGWSVNAPACSRCLANCAICSSQRTCDQCQRNLVVDVTGNYQNQQINPEQITVDHRGLGAGRWHYQGTTENNILQRAKQLMVDGQRLPDYQWGLTPHYERPFCEDPAWVQVDLGEQKRVGSVTVWHHWQAGPRRYCGQSIAISATGEFLGEEIVVWTTGVDYGPGESRQGNTINAHGATGRYVRHYCAGSNANRGAHFHEISVATAAPNAPGTTSCQAA